MQPHACMHQIIACGCKVYELYYFSGFLFYTPCYISRCAYASEVCTVLYVYSLYRWFVSSIHPPVCNCICFTAWFKEIVCNNIATTLVAIIIVYLWGYRIAKLITIRLILLPITTVSKRIRQPYTHHLASSLC